jgi:hypothetical protein
LISHYKQKEAPDNEPDDFKGFGCYVTNCDGNVVVVLESEQRLLIEQRNVVQWI